MQVSFIICLVLISLMSTYAYYETIYLSRGNYLALCIELTAALSKNDYNKASETTQRSSYHLPSFRSGKYMKL